MSFGKAAAASAGSSQLPGNIKKFEQDLGKFEALLQDATKLREADRQVKPLDGLSANISANLRTATDANISDLRREFSALNERYQSAKAAYAQRKEAAEASPEAPTGPGGKSLQQAELDQIEEDTSRLQFLERETGEILESQRVIQQITEQVGQVIDESHVKVVHIEQVVTEAKEEMVTGNEELAKAEEHQKTCDIA
jgi:chemotaxis protein histidine kinase CheA